MSNRPGRKMARRQAAGKSHTPKRTDTTWTTRRILAVAGASLLVVLLIAAIAAVATTSGDDDPGPPVNLAIALDEYTITGELESDSGNIVLDLSNEGGSVHNLVMPGEARSRDLRPGETQALEVGNLGSGTYELLCDIPGHTEAGMVATLTIN